MEKMEHFKGHLFNWYDTRDLRPLDPRYVSSVDSGNFAGHLIALANACSEWRREPRPDAQCPAGIIDAINLARLEAAHLREGPRTQTVSWAQLDSALASLGVHASKALSPDATLSSRLRVLSTEADTAADIALALANERGTGSCASMLFWVQAIVNTIEAHRAGTMICLLYTSPSPRDS